MRKFSLLLLPVLFLFPCVSHSGDAVSEAHADYLIQLTLQHFWGKAKLLNGEPVQPKDETERRTVPIPHSEAVRVVRAAFPAGLGLWCGADWKPYYVAFMKREQVKPWSQKQIAFVGTLFGATQGNIRKTMTESGKCSGTDSAGVKRLLDEAMRKLASGPSSGSKLFRHPSGVFEMAVPGEWEVSRPVGGTSVTSFRPKDGTAGLTVSVVSNLKLPAELPTSLLAKMFPDGKAISEVERREGANWRALRQDWQGIKEGRETVWLATLFGSGSHVVVITLSDEKARIDGLRALFGEVVASVKFR
ncbi:MAG: hypothetical protein AB1646_25980 [Thermodesulfobacteriota bacterium]